MSLMPRPAALALILAVLAFPAVAEDRLLVSSAFGDSSIVAPVVRYEVDQDDGTSWAVGLSGWTVDGEWTRRLSATRALRFTADATPLNAHNSDHIYVNGDRAPELEYDNASYRARGGLRFTPSPRHTTDVFLVALQESVEGVSSALAARWNDPYAGVEVAHTYSIRNHSAPLIASFDGIDVTARLEAFTGEESFSRISLIESAGRNYGRFHVRQSLALLHGSSLDVVNRFVAGGSWDSLGGTAVYGLRYGELRLRRALIASGGGDVRVAGNWRVGVRGSYVDGDDGPSTYGHALNASTTWRTIGANFGVGFPEAGDTIVYGALIVPLYKK
jgi:hypothetical protein